jgi:hypothetical protein
MLFMEQGDTIVVDDFYDKDDSIGFKGGKVGKADLLCIVGGRFVYEYALPKMKQYMVRKNFDASPCARARQFARKYAKVDPDSVDIFDPAVDSTQQVIWEDCFNDELIKMGVDPNQFIDPLNGVKSKVDVTSKIQLLITGNWIRFLSERTFSWCKESWGGTVAVLPWNLRRY